MNYDQHEILLAFTAPKRYRIFAIVSIYKSIAHLHCLLLATALWLFSRDTFLSNLVDLFG